MAGCSTRPLNMLVAPATYTSYECYNGRYRGMLGTKISVDTVVMQEQALLSKKNVMYSVLRQS